MAAEPNGRPAEVSKQPNGRPNGHVVQYRPEKGVAPTSPARRVFSLFARLSLWYIVLTALFRCPSSLTKLNDTTPRVCRPYIVSRTYLDPYIEPYYNRYAASYVETARPYLKTLEQKIVVPSIAFGKQSYETYGAPRVQQANAYGWDQWEASLKPHLHAGQTQAKQQYDVMMAPRVAKISNIAEPYYIASREKVLQVYQSRVLPAYTLCRPYVEKVYTTCQQFAAEIGIPYTKSTWASTVILFERTVWPQLRILYGENVEPQLVRIGQRLGRYRDGKKLKATVDEVESSSDSIPLASSISSASPSIASEAGNSDSTETSSVAIEAPDVLTKQQEEQRVREKVTSDLKNWQEKFAKAADKGTEDLEQRIKEITDRQMETQVEGVGEALIVQLAEASESEIRKLKKTVVGLVKALPAEEENGDNTKALEELAKATRQSGLDVRNNAQALRRWKEDFDVETQSLVSAALESTLEVIDNIRDLGLQEIGMRWAFMEGVTYKDWSKYHSVKKTFDEWRQEVAGVAAEHEGLQKAKESAGELESRGMAIAEDTAKELARLKELGMWKIRALDRSDDFSTRQIPVEAAKLGQKAMYQANEQATEIASSASAVIDGSKPGFEEDGSGTSELSSSGAKSDSITPMHISSGSETASSMSSVMNNALPKRSTPVSERSSPIASKASTKIYGGALAQKVGDQKPILDDLEDDDVSYSEEIQRMVEQAGEKYSDITDAVNEALGKATVTQGTAESVKSLANEHYSSALAAASSILYGTEQGTVESMTSVASDKYVEAVAAASTAIFGTSASATAIIMAQASSLYSEASSRAKEQYNHAKSIASAQISGSPKPVHEAMFSSIENAYAGSLEAASKRMESMLNAASTKAYGTAMSPQQSALSMANAKYSNAMAAASVQLESAKSKFDESSTPGYESFLSEASQRYSSLADVAKSQRVSALDVASQAYYGPTQGVLESISSVASSKLADSLHSISAQYSSIKTAAIATPTPAYDQYIRDGQRSFYEAIGLAHERYSEFISAASTAVYGAPTPTLERIYSAASEHLYGTPTPVYQNMLEAAQDRYSAAVAKASESLEAVIGSASSAVGKTSKSPAQSILDSASSSYSSMLSVASASLSSVSEAASSGIYGTSTGMAESIASAWSEKVSSISSAASSGLAGDAPWTESVASQAYQNWEVLVSKASEQVYGAPTPWSQSVLNQAGDYAAQATDSAFAQYEAIQVIFKEMMSGKKPDFTESVMGRLSSAFHTGIHASVASSASSYVSDTYASASSIVSSGFTPPASLEAIIQAASDQVNAVVDAASQHYYGSSKGTYEEITSAAANSYSAASMKASKAVYGTKPNFVEDIQASFDQVASSAQDAISAAIYGTTAPTDSATSIINNAYASVTSAVQENMASATSAMQVAQAKVSEALYGPEKGAVESASLKLQDIIQNARSRLAQLPDNAQAAVEVAQSGLEEAASSVSSLAAQATDRIKDEL